MDDLSRHLLRRGPSRDPSDSSIELEFGASRRRVPQMGRAVCGGAHLHKWLWCNSFDSSRVTAAMRRTGGNGGRRIARLAGGAGGGVDNLDLILLCQSLQ